MAAQPTNIHTYKDIAYALKKSDRKTTSIYIERDGSVSVLAPEPFDTGKIEHVLEQKRRWIYRGLAEWQDLNRTRVHRGYVSGESFVYLGRNYQLELVIDQFKPLLLKQGKFCLVQADVPQAPEHFKAFYKKHLASRLRKRLPEYAAKLGVKPQNFRVIELQNRGGSCTSEGVINIHWKCAMLPPNVLDYVLVHELAHLNHPNHTPAFWHAVEKVLLNYENVRSWLKFNGASMTL